MNTNINLEILSKLELKSIVAYCVESFYSLCIQIPAGTAILS